MEKTKIGETKFSVGKTPYANERTSYSAQRADKKCKVKSNCPPLDKW